ncbi:peptidoglycan editing factor PgeF [Salinisphaera sp. USBA-960]|nr:peptidoglycan editing factor PgeF [Salifodinibacter halophilus]NNC26540.1 peptidoglycan editing factor PgeF [Salifodinibacter halophilus]
MNPNSFITADWPAPTGLVAGTTTRVGGVSPAPRDGLDLGAGGPAAAGTDVTANRALLTAELDLVSAPVWLSQEHGARVADANHPVAHPADAAVATDEQRVCAVLTADCLPILLCDRHGHAWAAVHGGWRGLAAGVIAATVSAMPVAAERLLAWLGPAIGPSMFRVDTDVRDALLTDVPEAEHAFDPDGVRYRADLYAVARAQLTRAGVGEIYGGDLCTYSDAGRFFSYRRDGATGRMASVIGWATTVA